MLNNIDFHTLLKKAVLVVIVLIGILLTIVGVLTSEFNTIKKFDSGGKSPRELMSRTISKASKQYNTQISVDTENNMANLGDFTFNIGKDKKLIANISFKYSANKDTNWFEDDDIKNEIMKKNIILRDTIINTMIEHTDISASSKRIKRELKIGRAHV